jgi:hypothetical protein
MASACREEILVLLLAYIDSPAAAADENTGIWLTGSQSGIAPGFARRDDTEQRGPRVSFGVGTAVAILTLEWQGLIDGDRRNRSGNAAGITRRIELSDRSTPTDAVAQMMPIRLASNAERRYRADAGYHHATRLPVGRHDGHYNIRPCALTRPDPRISRDSSAPQVHCSSSSRSRISSLHI